jgi:hypothetical protein
MVSAFKFHILKRQQKDFGLILSKNTYVKSTMINTPNTPVLLNKSSAEQGDRI